MTLKTDIDTLVADAAKVHGWSNGNATHSEPFGSLNVRSPAKLIADKDEQINVAANGLLTQATAAATNAATQATNAANSAASVAAQALTASAQATTATSKAVEAATSAANSTISANASHTSAALAAASLVSVNSVFDSFDDRYLGAKYSDPTLDNDGNALMAGTVYYNTTASTLRFYNGAAWEAPTAAAATSANNAGYVREMVFPSVRVTADAPTVKAGEPASFNLQMVDGLGNPITRDADLYLETVNGFLPVTRRTSQGGKAVATVLTTGMQAGDAVRLKVGFKFYPGAADAEVAIT